MDTRFNSLLAQFRDALTDCRKLYVSAGQTCASEHPHLLGDDAGSFVQMMDSDDRQFLVTCPGCNEQTQLPQSYLLKRVKCRCGRRFMIEWASPS